MILQVILGFFIFYVAYAIYVVLIYPAHKKIKDDKVINFMKNIDK